MFSKLKQFREARQMHKALSQQTVEGTGAGGKVKMVMNASMEAVSVTIDPSLLTSGEKSKLEGAIKDAVTQANRKAMLEMAEQAKKMGKLPGASQ